MDTVKHCAGTTGKGRSELMTDKEFGQSLDRVVAFKKAQDEWADRMGKIIAQSTLSYVLILMFWSAIGGIAVGVLLGRLF